ncbi:MAG TPA: hypothetical protein VNQ77_01225 [Frankiaceae bacterium]|nr:hypothetical protein [Frankiaceae bacterium]
MTTTFTFWEALLWFTTGIAAVAVPASLITYLTVRREERKPRLPPVDPEEARRISAELASLSRAIARLADPEEPAAQQQEEVRSSA